jgi:hypothetical protein
VPKTISATNIPFSFYAGKYRSKTAPTIPAGTVQTFNLQNTSASTSPGTFSFGLVFKQGDVPPLSTPVIKRGGNTIPVQFDQRSSWDGDGSLRYCVCSIRDSSFNAFEERTYNVEVKLAEYDNSSTGVIGDITGATDFNIQLTNVLNSSDATHNGGTMSASFNTHAAVSTRVTKTKSGAICDEYRVWGFFNGSSEDSHLKTIWHVTSWKDAGGSIIDYQYGAEIAQDWYSTAGKDLLKYDCALRTGVTTQETFLSVEHPYHSRWFTIDQTNDDQYGRRKWVTAKPTLHYKQDRSYWISTKVIPPYDLTLPTGSLNTYSSNYSPCGNMDHRPGIDDSGPYNGRGFISMMDNVAFLTQDSVRTRHARVNAFAGLHAPFNFRDDQTRTRPGEGSDTSNEIISFIMDNLQASEYNFTAEGMGAPKYVSTDSRTSTSPTDYTGGYVAPTGGMGVWFNYNNNYSHAILPSFYMYLLEGEWYMLEGVLSQTTRATIEAVNNRANLLYYGDSYRQSLFTIPNDVWGANSQLSVLENHRVMGWSLIYMANGYSVCPDNEVFTNAYKKWVNNNMSYLKTSIDYLPQKQKDWGIISYHYTGISAPYYQNFIAMGSLHCHNIIGSTDTQAMADISVQYPKSLWDNANGIYNACNWGMLMTEKTGDWHQINNDFLTVGDYWAANPTGDTGNTSGDVDSTTDLITIPAYIDGMKYADNDPMIFLGRNSRGDILTLPTGIVEGQTYYVRDHTDVGDGGTFRISTTPGGAAFDFTDSPQNMVIMGKPAIATTTPMAFPPYLYPEDSNPTIARAALVMANDYNDTVVTDALVTTVNAFLVNRDYPTNPIWAFKEGQV